MHSLFQSPSVGQYSLEILRDPSSLRNLNKWCTHMLLELKHWIITTTNYWNWTKLLSSTAPACQYWLQELEVQARKLIHSVPIFHRWAADSQQKNPLLPCSVQTKPGPQPYILFEGRINRKLPPNDIVSCCKGRQKQRGVELNMLSCPSPSTTSQDMPAAIWDPNSIP